MPGSMLSYAEACAVPLSSGSLMRKVRLAVFAETRGIHGLWAQLRR